MSDHGIPVGIAHSCEGAGHATRMLAVIQELERDGYDPVVAGGGPGRQFVERNGYSEFVPREVDFVGGYQRGSLLVVLRRSLPNVYERVTDYVSWLERETPPVLVADDVCAAVAAAIEGTPYVYVSHDPAAFYADRTERIGARARNWITRATAEVFLVPKVWSGPPMVPGAVSIPPIAHEIGAGDDCGGDPDVDVLVVPSDFSVDQNRIADAFEQWGRNVTLVGGDDWEVVESLQPYVEAAEIVVCSGYSTVMEAAVAGTPCILFPHTSEQRGVARAIGDLRGFYPVEAISDVESLLDRVERPEPRDNGARDVVDAVATVHDR